ncbi:MAG TPA: glycosyltransferase [Gemmatimonadaceae bacterium]|nr:glycosyltransferase [Gemmatimonadaceae bacterium]
MLVLLAALQGVALAVLLARLLPGRRRRPAIAPRPEASAADGDVTVVVAALDEARRIQPCLDGLSAQGTIVGEILVVDSGSGDGTQDMVREAAARDSRITLLRDPPLPPGWVGKVWALQHGLTHARGEWVLGMDADTMPRPGCVGGALASARELGYDAVSFAPRFRIDSAGERWLQPALLVTLVYRFGATGTSADPERVMANGQCFLARRAVLEAAGGYSSARASFADDVTLARTLARAGRSVGFLDGSRLYDVRSYTSAGEAWREWGRSLDLKDATTRTRQWTDVLFLLVVQGTPLAALLWLAVRALAGQPLPTGGRLLLATSAMLVGIRVLMQFAIAGSYAERGVPFWLAPAADPLAALRILISTLRTPKRWRSREYGRLGA